MAVAVGEDVSGKEEKTMMPKTNDAGNTESAFTTNENGYLEITENFESAIVLEIPEVSTMIDLAEKHPWWNRKRWSSSCLPFLFFEFEREKFKRMESTGDCGLRGDRSDADAERHLEMALRNVRAMDDDIGGGLCWATREYLYMLIASLAIYTLDFWTDALMAIDHLSQMRIGYGILTIFLMVAPEIVSVIQGIFWSFYLEERINWKALILNRAYIYKSMFESIECALKSREDHSTIAYSYERFDKRRRDERYKESNLKDWNLGIKMLCKELAARKELETIRPICNASLLQSAPQALIQLIYCFKSYPINEFERILVVISVSSSLVNLAWAIHKTHFELHYQEGWTNDMESKGVLEFFGILFTKCTRIICLAKVIIIMKNHFTYGWLFYLTLIFLILCYKTRRTGTYQHIFNDSSFIPWPLYRMFAMNVEVGLWKLNSLDHLFYFQEIVFFISAINIIDHFRYLSLASIIIDCTGFLCGLSCLILFKLYFHEMKFCRETIEM